MRQAAAEGAAHTDRIMRDMARDIGQEFAERIVDDRLVKRGVTHAGADRQSFSVAGDLVEAFDAVDVDEMRGLGEPKRHDRHQALPAGQHAAVLRRDLAQNLQRFLQRLRRVADEWRWLHAADGPALRGLNVCTQTINRGRGLSNGRPCRSSREPFPARRRPMAIATYLPRREPCPARSFSVSPPSPRLLARPSCRIMPMPWSVAVGAVVAQSATSVTSAGSASGSIAVSATGDFHEHRHFVRWHHHIWVRPVGLRRRRRNRRAARSLHLPDQELHAGRHGRVPGSVHQGNGERAGRRHFRSSGRRAGSRELRRQDLSGLPEGQPAGSPSLRPSKTDPALHTNHTGRPAENPRGRPSCCRTCH